MPTQEDLTQRGNDVQAATIPPGVRGTGGAPDPLMRKFGGLVTATVMGAVWGRPGLDFKTRALICVVSDIATGRFPEIDVHARMALHLGWTKDELTEVALHMVAYVGAPLGREAMIALSDAFAAFDANAGS